ncbi:MAG: glycosyltransferase family 4 protein [Chitinophagales bacterium]
MKIGIDAKRIFLNKTGLGSYGRNLINGFNKLNIEDDFFLYGTGKSRLIDFSHLKENFKIFISKARVKAFWRSYAILDNLKKDEVEIYHGISNELPFSLKKQKKIKKIVDIHDLLFLRFPNFYTLTDRKMFEFKTKFACEIADKIIATSKATKQDIISYYGIAENKIEVVYQSCDDKFFNEVAEKEKLSVLKKYKLPQEYLLCVGTIQERKNQKAILEALVLSKNKIPLVLVGSKTKYADELIAFAKTNNIELIIPSSFVKDEHLPAIYQTAKAFVFPGLYEGFGIPVLEAMASKIPVITSLNTSMAEIVNNNICLVNPISTEDIKDKIEFFLQEDVSEIVKQNYTRAQQFRNTNFAQDVIKVYNDVCNK